MQFLNKEVFEEARNSSYLRQGVAILFISTMESDPWGGSEELWSLVAERLVEDGYTVSASIKEWPEMAPRVRQLMTKGITIRMRRRSSLPILAARRILKSPRNTYKEAINKSRPALIVISNGIAWPPTEAVEACLQAAVPFITIAHANCDYWFPPDSEAALLRSYFKAARACWFVSEANRRLVETQIGDRLPHAAVVRNPFLVPYDTELAWPTASDEGGEWRFACVGRLDAPSKGQDILFEALASERWKSRNWRLSLYGEGRQRETFQRLVKIHGIEDRVDFLGHIPKITEAWLDHHVLVLPSRTEGLPIAVVEAMLCGRIVVATAVAGNAEVIEDGVTGFLAAAPTVHHFSEALERAGKCGATGPHSVSAGLAESGRWCPKTLSSTSRQ